MVADRGEITANTQLELDFTAPYRPTAKRTVELLHNRLQGQAGDLLGPEARSFRAAKEDLARFEDLLRTFQMPLTRTPRRAKA
jgi:hypothetical protein